MLYKVNYIKKDIISHINNKEPFSLVRLGDGDLKLLLALVDGKVNPIKFNRSGIPHSHGKQILKIYRNGCNNSNYTSSFEMYHTDEFWNRKFSPGTKNKVQRWKGIYRRVGITNENFCNPEIGHLLFLDDVDLMNDLQDKRICLVTCFPQLRKQLKKKGFNIRVIQIPALNSGHYIQYRKICNRIEKIVDDVDIFFIGAGALGKGYSNIIKKAGGVSVDVGQVLNVWAGRRLAGRFRGILRVNRKNLTFRLADGVKKFRRYL